MTALITIDDQHLRGGRFDWESFVTKQYPKLWQDAVQTNKAKASKEPKKGRADCNSSAVPVAANVMTCIDKWATTSPGVQVVYDLFCDMVHPNIGSAFFVASVRSDAIYFTKNKGESVGRQIFEHSFPMLLSATQKPFGEFLAMLMGTIWDEGEIC